VESEEARLRERVREIQSEAQKAVAASSPNASGKWDQNEGKRLTEVCALIHAHGETKVSHERFITYLDQGSDAS